MNTIEYMNEKNIKIAENYYNSMLNKDFEKMESYLDSNVSFISPLSSFRGRDAVIDAAKNLGQILNDIQIRSKFSYNNQIMLAYDFIFNNQIDKLRSAVLMTFSNSLISEIELFYDGRPFEKNGSKIFQK